MATKPTDLPEWASDQDNIEEPPAAKKKTGWVAGEKPPHQWFNWFFNLVYLWLEWLDYRGENHAHDGGSDPESVAKVDLKNHVDWGDNGEMEVTQDDSGRHQITHRHSSGNLAEFITDRLSASGSVQTNVLRGDTHTVTPKVLVPISAGSLDVMDLTSTELAPINAANTAKAWGAWTVDGGGNLTVENSYGVERITRTAKGFYAVELSAPPPDLTDVAVMVTQNTLAGGPVHTTANASTADPDDHVIINAMKLTGFSGGGSPQMDPEDINATFAIYF